jgi:hypothetical protein
VIVVFKSRVVFDCTEDVLEVDGLNRGIFDPFYT